MATITVTRNSETFVRPYVPAPLETLELSAIDRVPGLRHAVRSLHVFRHSRREAGDKPADLIRAALSSALVDYYPLAGRFVGSVAAGDASVACTGDGALFIAAAADCSLEDVNCLDYPLMICEDELLPAPRGGVDPTTIPVIIQVTEFTCGGFVVGLSAVHTLADGLGAAQFINAIAEQSRGLPAPSVRPVWARELIPNPPKPAIGPSPTFRSFGFQHLVADVAPDRIARAKAEYLEATGQYCSAFDVAVSKTWQARTRAVKCSPGAPVQVCFFANTRHLLAHSLPEGGRGFYGNCFYPVTVSASAGDVAAAGLLDVIKMIRDGKARLPAEFARWAAGGTRADPYELTFEYNVLFVSDWTRLGFLEVDYGWGPPSHVVPFSYAEFMAVAVLGTPPAPKKGTRIMTQCVGEKHLREFQDEMEAF